MAMAALQAPAAAGARCLRFAALRPDAPRRLPAPAVAAAPRCQGVTSCRLPVQVPRTGSWASKHLRPLGVRAAWADRQSEPVEARPVGPRAGRPAETRLLSVAAGLLPALLLAFVDAELPREIPLETVFNDVTMSESFLKAFYMVFICVFSWGAVVFASMNDPYYESEEYRSAGGNGTQHWIYTRAEEEDQEAREELWREELRREIEGKMGDVKELEAPEGEKEKQLV